MQKLAALVLFLLSCSLFAQDKYSTNSTGDYATDLGQVYGAIRMAKFMGEICSESHPDQIQSNTAAFKQWRLRYLPFMQEMEKHFTTMAWRESGGDPQKYVKFLTDVETAFDGYRTVLKSQMETNGPEAFANQCNIYPRYLASERMDLEHYYAEQVAVIRKGQPK